MNTMDKDEARNYLTSLLNKNLRITSTDQRIFHGQFKCTDPDQNIVLSHTYEYRQPSVQQRLQAAQTATGSAVKLDMTSRYLGLVVVPGKHVLKIEVEEFASQVKTVGSTAQRLLGSGSPLGMRVEEGEAHLLARRRAE